MLHAHPRLYWCRACGTPGVETRDGNCPVPGCGRDKLVELTPSQRDNILKFPFRPRLVN